MTFCLSFVPRPSPHMRERGSGVLRDFSCHSSESLNQIAECVIICDDIAIKHKIYSVVCMQCMGMQ